MTVARVFKVLITSLVISVCSLAQANPLDGQPGGEYQLDLTHASILWKVSHFGLSDYVGRFNKFDATVDLNSDDFSKSNVNVEIDTASLDTDYPDPEQEDFNQTLIGDWFKGEEFPKISFKSTSVSELDGNDFTISGELTMLGKTLPVTLNAKLNGAMASHPLAKVPALGFAATTTIKRADWGIANFIPAVGAEVRVEIQAEFQQKS
jgi:Uncharacterized conserved protein